MANRRLETMEVHEVVRLKRLGRSNAEIGRLLGMAIVITLDTPSGR
jgi:hypothetical protein